MCASPLPALAINLVVQRKLPQKTINPRNRLKFEAQAPPARRQHQLNVSAQRQLQLPAPTQHQQNQLNAAPTSAQNQLSPESEQLCSAQAQLQLSAQYQRPFSISAALTPPRAAQKQLSSNTAAAQQQHSNSRLY